MLFLVGQFVMTPERQDAMNKAAVDIRALQGRIDTSKENIVQLNILITSLTAEKEKKIAAAKTKLGLDSTWSWDDKTNTFVQAKK